MTSMKEFLVLLLCAGSVLASDYSWQRPHAKVLPTGDLEWAPEPFVYQKVAALRYIDYEGGCDSADGLTPATAWKHHPLDPAAEGQAQSSSEYSSVFKRGVIYRGSLKGALVGRVDEPVCLTSDPGWGTGDAVICGSERVVNWKQGANRADIPEAGKVWVAELTFTPRCVWQIKGGQASRLALARTPNWNVSDPDDVMSEWFVWEQPEWWTKKNKTTVNGKKIHLGVDAKHLNGKAEDYVGGMVWSEWGIVMGTPFPSMIESFDPQKKGVGFQGFWYGDSGEIITGNRYFIEDKPGFLDAPGEFWFEKKGSGGRLYVRLPDDADPNTVQVEAACRINLMEFSELRHVRISGLAFRFPNRFWDLTAREFVHPDVKPACIRLAGGGEDIRIDHCSFRHVHKAVRLKVVDDADRLDHVVLADNDIQFTDHGAIEIEDSSRWGKKDPPFGELGDVQVLRNRLREVGQRAFRSGSSPALAVSYAETLEVAGNFLDRTYGPGIFVFGGKGSEDRRDRPLTRLLIHHNKVTQPLLSANDWGGIETWQGGPAYVYNNISGDPGGYWNWAAGKPGSARLGFAYYLDGAFKNYHFNNIAWGRSNDLNSKLCNRCAFYQAVPAVLNMFANNTAYNFAEGSSWSPAGGRELFLGNVWSDISKQVFLHGKQKEDKEAVYKEYPHETIAYTHNVFYEVAATLGFLEGSGSPVTDLTGFQSAVKKRQLLAQDVGKITGQSPLRDPGKHDFRPAAGGAAVDYGVKVFVPWALSRMVGEWNFRRDNADPARILDEHWYMAPHVLNREKYKDMPRFDLKGMNLTAESYVAGPLEDWTAGALNLNGRDQYLVLAAPAGGPGAGVSDSGGKLRLVPEEWLEVSVPRSFSAGRESRIEVVLKEPPEGQKLIVHLHWLKKQGWGGFNTLAKPVSIPVKGKGPYTFTVKPEDKDGLDAYSLLVALTPSGEWKDVTRKAVMTVPAGEAAPMAAISIAGPHDIDGSFLVEAIFKTEPGVKKGSLVRNMDQRGFELFVDGLGKLTFLVEGDAEAHVGTSEQVNDGRWHHVIAECDQRAKVLRIYLDGKLSLERSAPLKGKRKTDAEMTVGKGFSGSFEFLRISLGTLADAKTTIEELYAWQFKGPFLRDFAGNAPVGKRDAGALELVD